MSEIKSYHIFMFPFRWDYIENPNKFEESSFEEKVNIEIMTQYLEKTGWRIKSDEIECSEDYNEKLYFYDNVRRAIYNQNNTAKPIVKNFAYTPNEKTRGKYIIQAKDKEYILEIERIILKVYDTGVAILSYHLKNTMPDIKKEDIFMINEFGRRIYPQFINNNETERTAFTKGRFLATKLQILWEDDRSSITETFEWYDCLETVRKNPTKLSDTIMKLLNGSDNEYFIDNSRVLCEKKILIRPIIDDRMYVICWYKNDNWISELSEFNESKNEYMYVEDADWFKFLFVDGQDKCCTSRLMTENLLKQHTYDRWIGGTLYGITRYSFVMLCCESDFSKNILLTHMRTMYYQMVSLVLAQRASILVFSDEVSSISTLKGSNLVSRVRSLHKNYIQFVNKLYFREVTAQEQGIELYTQLINTCEIERNIKDLDNEISELHEYATLEQEAQTNTVLNWLTIISVAFVIPSFITGFLGMNIIDDNLLSNKDPISQLLNWLGYIYLGPIFIVSLVCSSFLLGNKSRLKRNIKFIILGLLFIILPFIILFLLKGDILALLAKRE
ncbi:CorA family divalent cation transporter [Defluviitalea raffinosedens]|uniref:Uncharacterized protein n=1 Tax=Defluviitalea raffinosedens TaxID=1450156 RepID=A0A7C8LGE2_9FIRM|nr:CorA family divalent cation transporter [Defluviitalea raffinosedens]KAE9633441.1 hypothetical protein GND95_09390 [Defluviitalea raffinosedens]MBM7687176.1 hypothetical protein [Defluviitalea raffinosedens]